MRHLVTLIEDLREQRIGFKSISDGAIDTTSASGEMIFNIIATLAQFERRLIQERTKADLAAARCRGKKGGRPTLPIGHENRIADLLGITQRPPANLVAGVEPPRQS